MRTELLHHGPFTLRNIRFAEFQGVSIDSRSIPDGYIFCALKGEHTDGHHYVASALWNGALAALVDRNYAAKADPHEALIITDDTYTGLREMASIYADTLRMPVFAITGSAGKTSTRRLLSHVLGSTMNISETPKNYNNHIGLPVSVLRMKGDEDMAILEMGSSGIGEIRELCKIIQPKYGLITSIGHAHIEGFGSIDNIQKAKFELYDAVRDDGILFINNDDERVAAYPKDKRRRVSYGLVNSSDFLLKIRNIDDNSCYTLEAEGKSIHLQSGGKGAAINAAAVYAAARTLGMDRESVIESIESFVPAPGRGSIENWRGMTLIDDTYNANPLSVQNALNSLVSMHTSGRRIMVFADMLEMGSEARSSHEKVGKYAAAKGIDMLLCLGKDSEYTVESAISSGLREARHFENKNSLADFLRSVYKPGDIILFKGSRGEAVEDVISLIKDK